MGVCVWGGGYAHPLCVCIPPLPSPPAAQEDRWDPELYSDGEEEYSSDSASNGEGRAMSEGPPSSDNGSGSSDSEDTSDDATNSSRGFSSSEEDSDEGEVRAPMVSCVE